MKYRLGISFRKDKKTKEIKLLLKIPEDMSLKEFLKNWPRIEKARERIKKLQK